MSQLWYQAQAGLRHTVTATSYYNLHSPFLYQLYQAAFLPAQKHEDPASIIRYRKNLKADKRTFPKTELGAKNRKVQWVTVKEEAARITIPPRYGRLLAFIVQHLNCKRIIELGTGLGVATAYLAYGLYHKNPRSNKTLASIEGCPHTLNAVKRHWPNAMDAIPQPTFYQGRIDEKLPEVLAQHSPLDLAFIDANHRRAAFENYTAAILPYMVGKGVLIADDIHWSAEMGDAWETLKADSRVRMTVDLYRMGIAFMDQDLTPVNLRLRF